MTGNENIALPVTVLQTLSHEKGCSKKNTNNDRGNVSEKIMTKAMSMKKMARAISI